MDWIDLNADLGENSPDRIVADDEGMLALVSSANVSCGFHAGTPGGIRETLGAAVARGVTIGAHPSYRDFEGFGRRPMSPDAAALQADVEEQLAWMLDAARAAGGAVRYVKPHGALYNTIARDERQARAVIAGIRAVDPSLVVLGLAGGVVLPIAAEAGLATAAEAFADRGYLPDGRLVPRTAPGAVLDDPEAVAERMVRFARDGVIRAVDGTDVRVDARSICVHGDSPGAVAMAQTLRAALAAAGIAIRPFVGGGR
ncbi:5-oxoprolinase subunit PxpA [Microbacterium pseudoresistens]|uniref:UPF0271 protein n=1 Tax=Microbacterium pseudoresistens TaxID=640634 RepID=A0A7Y9ETS4_9MICO|nr:5-oxoprolinase subunit PxpA [Microbacterium pseudoresistens]NYD53822.1 UPF0271 protein [Microbacterium pseudoresistens]